MTNEEMFLADWRRGEKRAMRDGYGEALVELGRKNERLIVLCADLAESTKADLFAKEFPERFVEVGIAEQNMMGVAAGMALSGLVPVVNSFACFSPGRNWEQLRISVAFSKTNVKIVGGHAGVGNGEDGGNQQMFEDLAITRVLPGMTVIVPADAMQIKKAVVAMVEMTGPIYMRMTKPIRPVITSLMTPFVIGKAQVWKAGGRVTVLANGMMAYESLMAAEELAGSVDVEVINVHTVKPLDKESILRSVKKTGRVVTAEEHSVIGGLGSAVAEVLSESGLPHKLSRLGVNDQFGESGKVDELSKKFGLTKEAVIEAVRRLA